MQRWLDKGFEREHFERNDILLLKSLTEMMANTFVS